MSQLLMCLIRYAYLVIIDAQDKPYWVTANLVVPQNYNSVNFEAIKNLSCRSLWTIKTKLFTRGIRNKPKIGISILGIQKWWCLSEQHHIIIARSCTNTTFEHIHQQSVSIFEIYIPVCRVSKSIVLFRICRQI